MTLKEILELPRWNNRLVTISKIHEFIIDPKVEMAEKIQAMKKLRDLMSAPVAVVDKTMVETYIANSTANTRKVDTQYVPEPGTPAGDDLARWYDELDRRGGYSGD